MQEDLLDLTDLNPKVKKEKPRSVMKYTKRSFHYRCIYAWFSFDGNCNWTYPFIIFEKVSSGHELYMEFFDPGLLEKGTVAQINPISIL